jgi:hypothetical protein
LRWAASIGACGVGEGRIIEIDVIVPGRADWEPVVLTAQEARVLHALLGDALADENPGRNTEPPGRRLYALPPLGVSS